jgi:aryl-alcohol dehydrogenase-like predicted oxidoreductase
MRYKLLGKSGLRVSELCLGTMTFGETWGWGASKEESRKMFNYYVNQGGNFIDTSVNYTAGISETFIGDFIEGKRDQFVIATKYTLTNAENTDPNSGGNSRKSMMRAVETSLNRLKTDYLDILYLHAWDYLTPIEEVLRGMDDLVRMGKVNYIAISDTPAWIIAEANAIANLRGWSPFIGVQVPYSLLHRDLDWAVLPMAKHWEMAVLPWGLLSSGVLTGKFLNDVNKPTRVDQENLDLSDKAMNTIMTVQQISEETGRSMAQVAINWVRQQQERALMIPILGARTLEQLQDNMGVLDFTLTDEQLQQLDDVSKIKLGFPHNFLPGNKNIFGQTFDKIDNHRTFGH